MNVHISAYRILYRGSWGFDAENRRSESSSSYGHEQEM